MIETGEKQSDKRTESLSPNIQSFEIPTPFQVGPVNAYLIHSDSLTLVDTGPKTAEAWESLKLQLSCCGYQPADIEQVVITHHHPDHVGLLDYFPAAAIIGHEKNQLWISKNQKFSNQCRQFYQSLYTANGVDQQMINQILKMNEEMMEYSCNSDLTKAVTEGDFIEGLPGWRVIETPGHAQTHIALYHETDGIMIGGDHIIGHISSNAIVEPPHEKSERRPRTLLQYRYSLEKCLTIPIHTVYPGHGKPVKDPHSLITERLSSHQQRADYIYELIKQESLTCYQLCQMLFPTLYNKQPALTISETLGHLDLLEEQGRLEVRQQGETYLYSKNILNQ